MFPVTRATDWRAPKESLWGAAEKNGVGVFSFSLSPLHLPFLFSLASPEVYRSKGLDYPV